MVESPSPVRQGNGGEALRLRVVATFRKKDSSHPYLSTSFLHSFLCALDERRRGMHFWGIGLDGKLGTGGAAR